MSKPYLFLIGALVLVIFGVGIFAYTRSTPTPVVTPTTSTTQTVPTVPPAKPAPTQNQISLTITSPKNGETVSTANVVVSGNTVPNADVAVNDKDIKADSKGNFSTPLTLDEGDNEIIIVASDETGNVSEQNIIVTYTPAQ